MATITVDGFDRLTDEEVSERFRALLESLSIPEGTAADAAPTPTMGS